jgi:hypothetical protein
MRVCKGGGQRQLVECVPAATTTSTAAVDTHPMPEAHAGGFGCGSLIASAVPAT